MPRSSRVGDEPRLRRMPMSETHLEQVLRIERASFDSPWRREHFLHEIRHNPHAVSWVLLRGEQVLAYVCAWIVADELSINNIAVHPGARRAGIGRSLLRSLLRHARLSRCRVARLDVRPSNLSARRMYESEGFVVEGRRRNYYRDEDAILMRRGLAAPPPGATGRVV